MSDQTMERIEKQLEGNSLALSAVAEVLAKMDGRLTRSEEIELQKAEEEEAAADRSMLIKEIASEVAGILKGIDGDAGMDVDGEKVRPAAKTGKTPANADDAEKPVNVKSNIADQQATIQAMVKAKEDEEEDMEKEDDEKAEEYPVDEKKGGMKYKAEDGDEEDDEEVAKAGNGEAKDDEDEDVEASMQKQLDALKKQIADYEANMEKAIKTESEKRVRKMGFREENGLQRPQKFDPLGVDGTTRIQKAQETADVVDQLAGMSYKELREMQTRIEAGDTEGIPRELLR